MEQLFGHERISETNIVSCKADGAHAVKGKQRRMPEADEGCQLLIKRYVIHRENVQAKC